MTATPTLQGSDGERGDEGASELRLLRSRGQVRGLLALLGPAFVASVAYVDPGNFATNFAAGAQFGYRLAWVIAAANLMAMLVQYLSAKVGVATGQDLPELCREHLPRAVSRGLWVQAELVAMATDVAEFVGAAIGLNLLFGLPLLPAGLVTAVAAFGILALDQRGYRRFELAIAGLLGLVLLGFAYDLIAVRPSGPDIAAGLGPHPDGRPRRPAAGGGHHRRHRDAARGVPALGPDQGPGVVQRRRRAPPADALPADRRDRRAGRRRADQPGPAVRRRGPVPPGAPPGRRARTWAAWSAAARRWPSRWRCSRRGCPRPAWAPTRARSSCR